MRRPTVALAGLVVMLAGACGSALPPPPSAAQPASSARPALAGSPAATPPPAPAPTPATRLAVTGAVAGGVTGELLGLGIPEEEAKYYDQQFRDGRTLMTVRAEERYGDASDIVRRRKGYDFETRNDRPVRETEPSDSRR